MFYFHCHAMFATYHHTCCASGHSKNLCSTVFTYRGPQCGQLLSTSSVILPHQSLTATPLWCIDQREATFFLAQCLSQITSHLGLTLPWRDFFHFLAMGMKRQFHLVIHFLLDLVESSRKGLVYNQHYRSRSKYSLCCFTNKNWNYLFKAPLVMMSTLTL